MTQNQISGVSSHRMKMVYTIFSSDGFDVKYSNVTDFKWSNTTTLNYSKVFPFLSSLHCLQT